MQRTQRRSERYTRRARQRSPARRIFGPMAKAGAVAYKRARDLPKLIALWPHELDDDSPEGRRHMLAKLRSALIPSPCDHDP